MRALDTPTAINELTILPKDWEERTIPFSKELAEILRQHPKVASCPLVFPSSKSHLNHRFLHARCKDICAQDLTQPSGISALPRHSGNTLAARGDRGQNRARVARPRVACDEGNGEPARSDEIAVLGSAGSPIYGSDFQQTHQQARQRKIFMRTVWIIEEPIAVRLRIAPTMPLYRNIKPLCSSRSASVCRLLN